MKNSCAFLTLIAVALVAAPGFAQDTEQERIDAITRDAVRQFAEARSGEDQTRPTNPPQPGVRVELTLDDAVKRALEQNLDIAVERLNPQTFDFAMASLQANYRPTLNSNFGMRSSTTFTRSQTAGGDILITDTFTGNNGITQNMKWGGGSFAVGWNNNRQAQSDLFATRNPAINSNLNLVYVQPLLRNLRIDGTRAQLKITQLNQEMSETALRATVVRTVANTRNAYWDFVFAIQAAEVAERSLQLASKLVEDNQARVEVGTLAPLDVVQAQAEQATRRQGRRHDASGGSHRGARAEAVDRQRHRRSLLGRQHRAHRSTDLLDRVARCGRRGAQGAVVANRHRAVAQAGPVQ
jgi:outer membrane protein TolC